MLLESTRNGQRSAQLLDAQLRTEGNFVHAMNLHHWTTMHAPIYTKCVWLS